MSEQIKIGDRLWKHDTDVRVYKKPGIGSGAPLLSAQFIDHIIIGETRVSWLCTTDPEAAKKYPYMIHKVKKATLLGPKDYRGITHRWYTDAGKENVFFCLQHRMAIASRVQVATAEQLKLIAPIVGYEVEP